MTSQPHEPTTVGPYTLLRRLGEGGMGVVHLARRQDGERVALKLLRAHVVGDEEARRRLAREVSSLERVRSRWVAEFIDADPWAAVPYVATRYVPGLSLHDHVAEEGPITGADLLWFAGCLAEGVASVHAAGVLHRDVKPSNVLMEGRTPILIDFGLARVADDPRLTHTGWLLGTPGYLAPEILYGDEATPASDLHSWAATVAFAGLGRAPFGRGPAMAIMDRVRRGETDLTGLPLSLRHVLEACLDPEPARRPTLDAVLAWLRPQTTRPQALLAAPPAPYDAGQVVDDFTLPLALANAGALPDVAGGHDREHPGDHTGDPDQVATAVSPVAPRTLVAPTLHAAPPTPPPTPPPTMTPTMTPPPPAYAPAGWHETAYDAPYAAAHPAPPVPLYPPPPPAVPGPERFRRVTLALSLGLAVTAVVVAVPYVGLLVLGLLTWLLRGGSLAAEDLGHRRSLRGQRWYDALLLGVHTPWRLVQAVPGTLVLWAWSLGLVAAAGLLCYATAAGTLTWVAAGAATLVAGLVGGPGSARVRTPVARALRPAARTSGWWMIAAGAALVVALVVGLVAATSGPSWTPTDHRPFARSLP